jgi:hypothetical protein
MYFAQMIHCNHDNERISLKKILSQDFVSRKYFISEKRLSLDEFLLEE